MKKAILFFSFIFLLATVWAKNKVVENPVYELKNTGIYNISKIELGDKETRLHIHSTFIPNWWVKFDKTDFIQDSKTGKRYYPTDIEGTKFGKETYMPASGDSSFVMIFPPLDKSTKDIDYFVEDDNAYIWGISLEKKQAKNQKEKGIPANVEKWINDELNKKYVTDDVFFKNDTTRIRGYIKGYDPRLDFSSGMIYSGNKLTNEDFPTVLTVHPDGRFEADWQINYPKMKYISLNNVLIDFYIEQGKTLGMVIDWEEFLKADRFRNIEYKIQIDYKGELADVNKEIYNFSSKEYKFQSLKKDLKQKTPNEFKEFQEKLLKENQDSLSHYAEKRGISQKAKNILNNDLLLDYSNWLFNYVIYKNSELRNDTSNAILKMPVSIDYYNFLQKIPMNDPSLLISDRFGEFINRFEYCEPFRKKTSKPVFPKKTFYQYLKEEKVPLNKEDIEILEWQNSLNGKISTQIEYEKIEDKFKSFKNIQNKYQSYWDNYFQQYMPKRKASKEYLIEEYTNQDSILTHVLHLSTSLVYEIAKVRSLKYSLKFIDNRNDSRAFLTWLEQGISNPFLKSEAERMFNKIYPESGNISYSLPEGKATDIFRKIIDPFKGKVLFIDFWATTCGPCVAGIKSMKETREKYTNDPDFDFIFITDERSSPLNAYEKFVKEQNLVNTYRLSVDDYNYLRQLFKFNGIPRYVVIDKEGKVLNEDFSMNQFKSELKKLFPKKKSE